MMKKRFMSFLLVILMVVGMMPGMSLPVHADNPVFARIYVDGVWKMDLTDSISTLNSYINSNKNHNLRIEMLTDWNAAAAGRQSDFDKALVIPSGARVTLDMHGHVFNRDNAWKDNYSTDGEVILVESNATLTINGSSNDEEKNTLHKDVPVYTSTNKGYTAIERKEFTGGLIMGGVNSAWGGGLTIKTGCTVTLNDVTIAGCCSRDTGYTDNGYGGAIRLRDDDCRLTLNNCLITGNMSDDQGGGICVCDDDTFLIELNNTIIEKNFATNKGGGIYIGGEGVHINGTGETYIRNNASGKEGGGIYLEDQNESVSGLTVSGNSAKLGGGIYMEGGKGIVMDSAQVLTDLVIKDNKATGGADDEGRGGGLYLKNNAITISSCEITGNSADMSGGGVYVHESLQKKFNVKGTTVVKDNSSGLYGGNLYISNTTPENTRVMFSLTKGAEVWMSYYGLGSRTKVMVTEGEINDTIKSPNCIQYLHADNQGWHFSFNASPNQRKIYYVKDGSSDPGTPVVNPPEPTVIEPQNAINEGKSVEDHGTKAGKVGEVGAGGSGGNTYDLIRAFMRHQETDSDDNDAAVAFYYSDAFFDDTCDPKTYNVHLATASINMAYAGMYLRAKEPEDANDNYYYNKHGGARQFMADIGCPDQNIYVNDSNEKKPGTDSIGVTIASKELTQSTGVKTGKTLIAIATRGGGYELEWASNGTLNRADQMTEDGKMYEAYGFSNAADQVMDAVETYIQKYELEDEIEAGNVKFWIAGYSRGGATANITAKRLIEKYADGTEGKNNQVFAYTCEAPMGGSDQAELLSDKTKYYSIHNMINDVDVVPLVAPAMMGFKRYGVDHYIPGTAAGEVKEKTETAPRTGIGNQSRTTYSDNERILIKQLDSGDPLRREAMLEQLKYVESGILLDDYFHPMAMDLIPPHSYEEGNYDNNHVESLVKDLLRFAQAGVNPANSDFDWSQTIKSRTHFADDLQPAIRDMMAMVFAMDPETMTGFSGRAGTIADRIPLLSFDGSLNMTSIYSAIFKTVGWHRLSAENKQFYRTALWDKLKETGALDYLSKEDAGKLEKHWPVLLNTALTLAEADFNYDAGNISSWASGADTKFMLLISFATFSNFILQNHYPEVNLAWARAYDDYYDYEAKEYRVKYQNEAAAGGYSVAIPAAFGDEGKVGLEEGDTKNNNLSGDQRIILENEEIVGEAVYYDLIDNDSGKQLTTNLLYRGGVDLSLGTERSKSYTIKTYDISYGVRSSEATYNINLVNDKHQVIVHDGSDQPKEYLYREGDVASIAAATPADKYFARWKVELLDKDGARIGGEDIGVDLLGTDRVKSETATFKMPAVGAYISGISGDKYPEMYSLVITAQFGDRITEITSSLPAPAPDIDGTEGQDLEESTDLSFDTLDDLGTYPVVWTYTYEGKTYPATDTVYSDVEYTATITVPKDTASGIVFAQTVDAVYDGDSGSIQSISARRNDADGSATVTIVFVKTASGGSEPPQAEIKLSVKSWDMNLNDYAEDSEGQVIGEEYHTNPGSTITLTAPDVPDEVFERWNFLETGITPETGYELTDKTVKVKIPNGLTVTSLEIRPQYIPVIKNIAVTIDAPEGGMEMQTDASDESGNETLKVTISNDYVVDSDFVKISWSPEPTGTGNTAEFLTSYTATVTIEPQERTDGSKYIKVIDAEGNEIEISGTFLYSEDLNTTVNGNDASCDREANSVSYTFPMTKYLFSKIEQPSDISDVPHGTSDEEIIEMMPQTVVVLTENGKRITVPLDPDPDKWTISPVITPDDTRESKVVMVSQLVELPDTVDNPTDKPHEVNVRVTIDEADIAQAPKATLNSGTFLYDQQTELSTEENDGDIYYVLGKSEGKDFIKYTGGPIDIKRDDPNVTEETVIDEDGLEVTRKVLYLNAYTKKSGKWDSMVVTYQYIFDNVITVPETEDYIYNGEEQIGIGNSLFYTIESVSGSGSVSEDGDAVATNAGTYSVTLKIREGFKWKLPDGTTTAEEQTLNFTIAPEQISEAITVSADGDLKSLDDLKKALKVEPKGSLVPSEGADYEIHYGEVKDGKVAVTVTGKGNYTGTITSTFIINEDNPDPAPDDPDEPDKEIYTITYDLNGGAYNGSTDDIKEEYSAGETIKIHAAPVRDGYVFDYWEGSRYEAGEDYVVTEDHTFTARWKKTSPADNNNDEESGESEKSDSEKKKASETGDESNWILWLAIMCLSILVSSTLLIHNHIAKNRKR